MPKTTKTKKTKFDGRTDGRTDGQTDGWTDQRTDGPTKRCVESRSTRLKKKIGDRPTNKRMDKAGCSRDKLCEV